MCVRILAWHHHGTVRVRVINQQCIYKRDLVHEKWSFLEKSIFLSSFFFALSFLITKTMPPIALKFSSDAAPFDSESELQKAWQVCTKVKDALDNGSRLENMSWRLWFVRNADNQQQQQQQQHYHPDRMQHIMNELWANDNDDDNNTMETMVATENKEPVQQQQQQPTEVPFSMIDEIQEPEASLSLPSLSPPSNHTTPLIYDAQREYRRLLWQQQLDQLQQLCLHNSLKAIESDASAAAVIQEEQITPAPPPPPPTSTCHTSSKMASCRNAYSIGTIHFPQPQQRTKKASIRRSLPVQSSSSSPVCSNCETTTTPLWRRSADDQLLCNACGL